MTTPLPDALQQIFPSSELWRGGSRKSIIYSLIGSLLLALIFFNLYLLADLLATGEYLFLPESAAKEMEQLTGTKPDGTVKFGVEGGSQLIYGNQGLLPAVWHSRQQPWGWLVRQLYLRAPGAQDTST